MAFLDDLINSVNSLSYDDVAEDVFVANEDLIAELQREQMLLGLNSEGRVIGYYLNQGYRFDKMAMNPYANGTVDLRLTGEFYAGIYATVIGDEVIIESSDEKTAALEKKYNPNGEIFGLSDYFETKAQELGIAESVTKEVKNRLRW